MRDHEQRLYPDDASNKQRSGHPVYKNNLSMTDLQIAVSGNPLHLLMSLTRQTVNSQSAHGQSAFCLFIVHDNNKITSKQNTLAHVIRFIFVLS